MKAADGSPRRRVLTIAATFCAATALAACQSGSSTHGSAEIAPLDESPIFSVAEYGVPASPRVTNLKRVPKGGGRDQIGKPYKVRGKWYYPKEEPGYVATGKASWYGSNFHGRLTANGEVYDMYHLSAAHPTFPLPSYARVTNEATGSSVMVRVNDRGPYAHGRVVDLSQRAAEVLDFKDEGIAKVKVEYLGRAPLEGDDTAMLMASYRPAGARSIDDGLPSGVMIASNERAPSNPSMMSFSGSTPLPGVRQTMPSLAAPAVMTGAAAAAAAEAAAAPIPSAPVAPLVAPTAPDPALAVPLPLPAPRVTALSYAAVDVPTGSMRALVGLAAAGPAQGERIEIGTISDPTLFMRVAEIASENGTLVEEPAPQFVGAVDLAIETEKGADVDSLLRSLWQAGASDAFVLRD